MTEATVDQIKLDNMRMEFMLGGELNRLQQLFVMAAAMQPPTDHPELAGKISIVFSGSGDSGGVDEIYWGVGEAQGPRLQNNEFYELAEMFVGHDVDWNEINEGSQGCVYIDLEAEPGKQVRSEVDYFENYDGDIYDSSVEYFDLENFVQRR